MRGGTGIPFALNVFGQGLSPHARGNRSTSSVTHDEVGPIPACAGEPANWPQQEMGSRAYPRMRGGTDRALQQTAGDLGLSPHARGNL